MTRDARRLREGFVDPPAAEYGDVPFWWWDGDELDEDRITDQLETLAARGVEAVCFEQKYPHGPPEGPQAPYFSEEWWSYMEHAVAECDRLGLSLWIHDLTYHHSPPSWKRYWQTRAEEAIDDHPEFQGHVVDRVAETIGAGETATLDLPAEFTPVSVAAYPARPDGTLSIEDAVVLSAADGPDGGTVTWTAPERSAGDGPMDEDWASHDADGADEWHIAAIGYRPGGLCRTTRDVVDWILENHYGEYVERLGDALGDTVVGTFQDELFVLQGTIPCDRRLLDSYRAEWGEALDTDAIALFEDCGEGTAAVRTRFWDVVVTALEDNWFRPLYEFHERRGMRFAHDNWGRNDVTEHATEYGDYVRTMRWFQEPGYDDGGRFDGVGTRNFFDAKLAASIAACYGRDRVWGELFHTTGWGFPLDQQLAGIAENACYGLDRYNKHGLYYATLGGWYEHAPPDTHFRQPYWEQADAFNDAVTRLMYLCSRGDRVVDAAMLYPITSVQAGRLAADGADRRAPPELTDAAREIDERTREIAASLYADVTDLFLVDHETVRDGTVADGHFAFGGGTAEIFVLGPVTTIRRAVAETLVAFVERGGALVSLGRLPTETVEGGADDPVLDRLRGLFDADPADSAATSSAAPDLPTEPAVTDHADGGVAIRAATVDALASVLDAHVDRDVRAPADVYHAHRRVGDYDLYLFLNTRPESRTVELDVRATGRPERWDVHDGTVEPRHEYERDGRYTALELDFEPHEFHVIGFDRGDGAGEPHVLDTSLSTVTDVTATAEGVRVSGLADADGPRDVTVATADGDRLSGESDPVSVPDAVALDDGWSFDLDPTMHNRWGDFRHPADDDLLGPEVRTFERRTERPDEDGVDQGWCDPDGTALDSRARRTATDDGPSDAARTVPSGVDDRTDLAAFDPRNEAADGGEWTPTRWSYGPQFWRRSPGDESADSGADGDGSIGDERVTTPDEDPADWEPYTFSTRVGTPGTHPDDHGHNGVVSDDFLVAPADGGPTHFWTTVAVDTETRVACHAGDGIRRLSVGGEAVPLASEDGEGSDAADPVTITLPAGRSPVHAVVDPDTQTHVALEPEPATAHRREMAYLPRLRWFHESETLAFDPTPWVDERVDWFRFALPVGTTAFSLPVAGDRRVWVDGEERSIGPDDRVELDAPRSDPATVAVRTVGDSALAGGSRWRGPVSVETDTVTVSAGDWVDLGLTDYSGVGAYRRTVSIPPVDEGDRVVLDLGDVGVSARVAVDGDPVGTVFTDPYEVDLTDAVTAGGDHRIEIRVANTLANHFATETPTRYVYDGQRRSGLFGPVRLRVERGVDLTLDR